MLEWSWIQLQHNSKFIKLIQTDSNTLGIENCPKRWRKNRCCPGVIVISASACEACPNQNSQDEGGTATPLGPLGIWDDSAKIMPKSWGEVWVNGSLWDQLFCQFNSSSLDKANTYKSVKYGLRFIHLIFWNMLTLTCNLDKLQTSEILRNLSIFFTINTTIQSHWLCVLAFFDRGNAFRVLPTVSDKPIYDNVLSLTSQFF